MPRGVAKNGKRAPWGSKSGRFFEAKKDMNRADMAGLDASSIPEPVIRDEPEYIIDARIKERFEVLDLMTQAAITGEARSLIISGPPGLGKSFSVEKAMRAYDPYENKHRIVRGYVKPTGLYRILYEMREEGKIVIFDDSDGIFVDEVSLNMLKVACDTSDTRTISYLAETRMKDEESGENLPRTFEFKGTLIYISNLDFDNLIERGHRLSPHLAALISRSHYIDLAMKNRRDYLVRIKQVVGQGMLSRLGFSKEAETDVVNYVYANASHLRELSLRIVLKIATLRKTNPTSWERVAKITCCREKGVK